MPHANNKKSRLELVVSHHTLPDLGTHRIDELLQRSAERHPDSTALSALGRDLSYQQLWELSGAVQCWLLQQQLPSGARIAVALPNMLAHPIACLGIIRAGFTAVCVNPLYSAEELEHSFRDSDVQAVFLFEPMCESVAAAMQQAGVKRAIRVSPGDQLGWKRPLVNWVARKRMGYQGVAIKDSVSWQQVIRTRPGQTLAVSQDAEQPAVMIYSGGTTGQPKGVPISHKAMIYNVAQQMDALRGHLSDVKEGDYVLLLAVPLYHILGLGNLLFTLARGGKVVLVMNPRDSKAFVREWSRHAISSFPAVNTLFNGLLETSGFETLDFSHLRLCIGAGMPVSTGTAARWFETTGCHITEAYGMTETGLISCNPPGASRPGSVGKPVSGIDISLRDDDDNPVSIGEGEICVRSDAIMSGYWQRPNENAVAFTDDGYFRTGDIGSFDSDGYLSLVDRKKEMIISAGFKVFPSEVERVINAHPGVLESAVVAAPDPRAGEVPVAYVVRRQPALEAPHLLEHCAKHLANYKRPRRVIFRDELPKSNVGKILRKVLANEQEKLE